MKNVRYGLPLLPDLNEKQLIHINEEAIYSCAYCRNTITIQPTQEHECNVCKKHKWIKAINEKRIT